MIVLTASVVPWTNETTAAGSSPCCSTSAPIPLLTARAGSLGTDGTFRLVRSPLDSSNKARSVKVPPMSIPSRYGPLKPLPPISRRVPARSGRHISLFAPQPGIQPVPQGVAKQDETEHGHED